MARTSTRGPLLSLPDEIVTMICEHVYPQWSYRSPRLRTSKYTVRHIQMPTIHPLLSCQKINAIGSKILRQNFDGFVYLEDFNEIMRLNCGWIIEKMRHLRVFVPTDVDIVSVTESIVQYPLVALHDLQCSKLEFLQFTFQYDVNGMLTLPELELGRSLTQYSDLSPIQRYLIEGAVAALESPTIMVEFNLYMAHEEQSEMIRTGGIFERRIHHQEGQYTLLSDSLIFQGMYAFWVEGMETGVSHQIPEKAEREDARQMLRRIEEVPDSLLVIKDMLTDLGYAAVADRLGALEI